ncbi:MAG: DUF2269 family protein [Chloroflexota bacterium]
MDLGPWFLFLHVLGAIIAFGPTFTFPIIGAMGGSEPMHANFATRVSGRISERVVLPLAIFQAITGVGLILTHNWDVLNTRWLLAGIILYLIALANALFILIPTTSRIIAMTSAPPPPGAAGPPPELPPLIRRVQRTGAINAVLIVLVVLLMVLKPAF